MDDKDLELETIEELELLDNEEDSLEKTKELKTLKDLSLEALESMESSFIEEFDEQREEAEEIFEEKIETLEESETIEPPLENKEKFFSKMKRKWHELEKKKKIFIIVSIVLIIALIIGVSLFFLLNKKEETPKEPDVILESDNYRYENGKLIFLENEKEIGTYECKNKNEELCAVTFVNSNDEVDTAKRVDEKGENLKLRSPIYKERYVFLIDSSEKSTDEIKLYDIKEQKIVKTVKDVVISPEYEEYVILKNEDGAYGIEMLAEEIETVIPYSYDFMRFLPNQNPISYVVVKKDNNYYLTDMKNNILTKGITTAIVGANEKYIKAKDSANKYHIYDRNNGAEMVDTLLADYVTLLDEYILYAKEEKLFVIDYNGNKMNLDGIDLYNDTYNPVETYKNYKLTETKKSFDYELNGKVLNINVYNGMDKDNYSYNLNEGNLSAKIPFINYLEGKLIFYEDEEKTKEIGRYSCKNYNTVDDQTKEIGNCFLAKESFYHETQGNVKEMDESDKLGSIPLVNKKYIFIKDGDKIILYDLEEQNEIASYESVDASAYTNAMDLMFVTPKEMPFIAKSSSSNKFGVAVITQEGVKSVLKFEYESIKKLGDYYVVQSEEGYKLYKLDGTPVDMEFKKSPIVDYHKNYLKTYDGNNYYAHSFKEDYKDSYNYIELYDEFYAGVVNNRVHLYRYDDSSEKKHDYIYEEDEAEGLKLNLSDYEKAFKITIQGTTINVSIASSTGEMKNYTFSTVIQTTKPKDEPTVNNPENKDDESKKEEDDSVTNQDDKEGDKNDA